MESAAQPTGAPGEPQPAAVPIGPGAASTGESPASAHAAAAGDDPFATRPELFVGAAFAGGLVLAQILKRLRR